MSNNIPVKPAEVTWTDDQWKAIYAKGQDILVAAAAGSGKTAVLVERMIQKIIATDEPIDVDQLLVVTFTNAAAAEMRHRIGEALEKAINANPTSVHLRKQLSLLNRASISTLHSFCLEVIRKYYYLIDIDPGFRIADETEAQLLRDEVMDELFEDEYGQQNNDAFFCVVDTFTNDRSDVALQTIIEELYDFSRANASPDSYLAEVIDMYNVDETQKMDEFPFMQALLFDVELQLEGVKQLLNQGLALTKLPAGPAPRADNFTDDVRIVDTMLSAKNESWQALYEVMQNWSFSRAKPCKGDEFDKSLIDRAQKIREQAKKTLQKLQAELFERKPESFIRDMHEMKDTIATLVDLVKKYALRFEAVKQEKGLVDFADLEHYCLEILTGGFTEDGTRFPSEAALTYRNQFAEVLVDEYQDVNLVQEAIVQLVTKDGEQTGNLFMVGDVKQSIYRFRLAEPNLFLGKYNRFTTLGTESGLRIDLAKNFRSRGEVLAGTNYLFKQVMGVKVGEIEYDEAAELKLGASYPEDQPYPVELMLIDMEKGKEAEPSEGGEDEDGDTPGDLDAIELAQSELEARLMATKIKTMIEERKLVYNAKTKSHRPMMYRDVVILLRSMTWAPQIMEEFKQQGIPIYANLSSGYFEATEVAIMLSLLKVIDNPHQDIPLAAVLRSPIVRLNEEDLALIRVNRKNGSFFDAVKSFIRQQPTDKTEQAIEKVARFLGQLDEWRSMARQGSLSELIWQLYRDTYFYDFVGGLPGGKQRQANLRAFYDRARQYEATSFRGLFRFLRFIERMRDRGDDLGAARALGEQEDVVRIMTIHSSKGLEFPVVFIAGLARQFNTMDLKKSYMLDKEFGFATKYVNPDKRISYPSLPQLAFKRKKKLEMLAEEMRVLYVALTRAKENLYLLASVKDANKLVEKWSSVTQHQEWLLTEFDRAKANSYLDWIGPSLVRHHQCQLLVSSDYTVNDLISSAISKHMSNWSVNIIKANTLMENGDEEANHQDEYMEKMKKGELISVSSDYQDEIEKRLSWKYAYGDATSHRSKQSVTEMKRQQELADAETDTTLVRTFKKPILNRPRFMQEKQLSPAERGTAMHAVMQHVDLTKPVTDQAIEQLLVEMVHKELLTVEQKEVIDITQIAQFFESELGQRLIRANQIRREVPFSMAISAKEAFADWQDVSEPVLLQGVIDCLFEDDQGLVLLDYKTDGIQDRFKGGFNEAKPILEDRYKIQIDLYTKAIENTFRKQITERYLYFFDGGHLLKLQK